jgi:hypothetical protein
VVKGYFFLGKGSRGQGQDHRRAAKELAEEVEGRASLLPARKGCILTSLSHSPNTQHF